MMIYRVFNFPFVSNGISKIFFLEPDVTIECPSVWEENDGSKYCFVISKADWAVAEVN